MTFRPSVPAAALVQAQHDRKSRIGHLQPQTVDGAAQAAKESAARWVQSNRQGDLPGASDRPPDWFSGDQPLSRRRFDNSAAYDTWAQKARMGAGGDFFVPPPEAQPMSNDNKEAV